MVTNLKRQQALFLLKDFFGHPAKKILTIQSKFDELIFGNPRGVGANLFTLSTLQLSPKANKSAPNLKNTEQLQKIFRKKSGSPEVDVQAA